MFLRVGDTILLGAHKDPLIRRKSSAYCVFPVVSPRILWCYTAKLKGRKKRYFISFSVFIREGSCILFVLKVNEILKILAQRANFKSVQSLLRLVINDLVGPILTTAIVYDLALNHRVCYRPIGVKFRSKCSLSLVYKLLKGPNNLQLVLQT